jgi:aryl-alcohol dehydrogenase (NADP+)
MYAWQFSKALYLQQIHGWSKFVTMQNHYNLLNREEEREMIPLCRDQGIGMIPWSPLARGKLTRDWDDTTNRSENDEFGKRLYSETSDRKIVERVAEVATQRGVSRAQVALAWLLRNPAVSAPIIGASKASHLDDAVASLSLQLSDEEVALLEEPYEPHAIAGF